MSVPVIRLSLLHPGMPSPLQNWAFEAKPLIRIGRAEDNDIVLYSAVVSRHHLEIKWNGLNWELINLGINGTYVDGKEIDTLPVVDGTIFRIATSGPKLQIHFPPQASS